MNEDRDRRAVFCREVEAERGLFELAQNTPDHRFDVRIFGFGVGIRVDCRLQAIKISVPTQRLFHGLIETLNRRHNDAPDPVIHLLKGGER